MDLLTPQSSCLMHSLAASGHPSCSSRPRGGDTSRPGILDPALVCVRASGGNPIGERAHRSTTGRLLTEPEAVAM